MIFNVAFVYILFFFEEIQVDYFLHSISMINFRINTESLSGKLDHKIEADSQQKLVMRFLLRDSANKKPMRVHQAFVRLTSVSSSANDKRGHEIFFVAEPDATHVYKFDMVIAFASFDIVSKLYCLSSR